LLSLEIPVAREGKQRIMSCGCLGARTGGRDQTDNSIPPALTKQRGSNLYHVYATMRQFQI
jgi:hypothetical protein